MNIVIKHVDVKHVIDCVNILQNSEIGKIYFGDYEKTVELLSNASVKPTACWTPENCAKRS